MRVKRTTPLPLSQKKPSNPKQLQPKAAELAEAIALYEAQLAELRSAAAGGGDGGGEGDGEAAQVCCDRSWLETKEVS